MVTESQLKNSRRPWLKYISLATVVALAVLAVLPQTGWAQVGNPADQTIPTQFGIGSNTDIRLAIIRVVQYLLGFLGLLAVIIVIYGGYLWMTAAGNATRIEEAQKVLKNGLIGLAIILAAYGIVFWIISAYFGAGNPGGTNNPVGGTGGCLNCFSLGAG